MLLAVHFMICQSDSTARPGQYRPGWVGVRDARTGEVAHEGVDRDQLEPLIHELLDYVNHNVSYEDAIAAIDGEDPANTDRDTWRAVVGYREAMDYILQRRQSPSFTSRKTCCWPCTS